MFEECSVYRKGVACREDRSEVNAAEGIVMSSKKKVSGEVGEEGHGGSWAVGKRAAAHASVYKPARFAGENTEELLSSPFRASITVEAHRFNYISVSQGKPRDHWTSRAHQ